MVRIRLQRLGRTHRPFYRIGVVDSRVKLNGKVLENLGWYNPMAPEGDPQVELKADRIKDWLSRGAQPSETVRDLLAKHDVLDASAMADWEAERAAARRRVECKQAVTKAEATLTELTAFSEAADADVASFVEAATAAKTEVEQAARKGDPDTAAGALSKVTEAFEGAKKADEDHKAKEAAAAAEAEAAEKAAAEAEGGEPAAESEEQPSA